MAATAQMASSMGHITVLNLVVYKALCTLQQQWLGPKAFCWLLVDPSKNPHLFRTIHYIFHLLFLLSQYSKGNVSTADSIVRITCWFFFWLQRLEMCFWLCSQKNLFIPVSSLSLCPKLCNSVHEQRFNGPASGEREREKESTPLRRNISVLCTVKLNSSSCNKAGVAGCRIVLLNVGSITWALQDIFDQATKLHFSSRIQHSINKLPGYENTSRWPATFAHTRQYETWLPPLQSDIPEFRWPTYSSVLECW